jgi:hypothetical protein
MANLRLQQLFHQHQSNLVRSELTVDPNEISSSQHSSMLDVDKQASEQIVLMIRKIKPP